MFSLTYVTNKLKHFSGQWFKKTENQCLKSDFLSNERHGACLDVVQWGRYRTMTGGRSYIRN